MRDPRFLLARWRALGAADRWLLLSACALIPIFAVGVRRPGLAALQRWMRGRACTAAADHARASHVVGLVRMAGSRMPGLATCLTRSLTAQWLLGREGVPCVLRIGARPSGASLDAHAWLECGGRPVGELDDVAQRYPVLNDPPAGGLASRRAGPLRADRP